MQGQAGVQNLRIRRAVRSLKAPGRLLEVCCEADPREMTVQELSSGQNPAYSPPVYFILEYFMISRLLIFLFATTLASAQSIVIDSIEIQSLDLFADTKFHSQVEKNTAHFFSKFHIRTRPSLIHSLLPFKAGDTVSVQTLKDMERFLRTQPYLNTAKILFDSTQPHSKVKIEVQDKWSLSPMFALAKPADKWDWALGMYEYNLLGLGVQTGIAYINIRDKSGWRGLVGIPNFLLPRQRLDASIYSDGQSYDALFSVTQNLGTLDQRWAWSSIASSNRYQVPIYIPNNQVIDWKVLKGNPDLKPSLSTFARIAGFYKQVQTDSLGLNLTYNRPLGHGYIQANMRSEWILRHHPIKDSLLTYQRVGKTDTNLWQIQNYPSFALREDWWNGIALQYHLPNLLKFKNFHKLKYTEDVDLGFKIASGLYADLKPNDGYKGFKWSQGFDLGAWLGSFWLSQWTWRSNFRPWGPHADGSLRAKSEQMWILAKHPDSYGTTKIRLSLLLNNEWNQIWQKPSGEYLQLSSYDGLSGTPDFAYVGRATSLNQLELRYIPSESFEIGTLVPAFSSFINAGHAWDYAQNFSLQDLDYRFGLGLRLGASKSVQGIINTMDLSWPLQNPEFTNPTFNLIAKYTF